MFAALILLIQGQGLDIPVTFQCAATSTTTIVERIAAATHSKLEAPNFEDWPIVVSVKDVKLSELMARIAEATDSEWTTSGERHTLVRDKGRVVRARQAEINDRAARIAGWMESNLKLLPATPLNDDQIRLMMADSAKKRAALDKQISPSEGLTTFNVTDRSPAEILLHDFIRQFGVGRLAAVPINTHDSYSDVLSGRVSRLPFSMSAALNAYRHTRERYARLEAEMPPPSGAVLTQYELAKRPVHEPLHLICTVFRPDTVADTLVQVTVLDANDALVDMAGVRLKLTELPPAVPPGDLAGRVELSGLSKELLIQLTQPAGSAMTAYYHGDMPIPFVTPSAHPISPELDRTLHHPLQTDPMALFASDWVLQLAKARAKQLVAYVPGNTFTVLAAEMQDPDLAHLWKAQTFMGLTINEADSWMVVKPTQFGKADRYRVNRRAFSEFLAAFEKGIPTTDQAVTYAAAMPESFFRGNLDVRLLQRLHPGVYNSLQHEQGILLARFLSTLSSEQRQGCVIPLAALTPWQLATLRRCDPKMMYSRGFEQVGMMYRKNIDVADFEPAVMPNFDADELDVTRKASDGVAVEQADGTLLPMSVVALGVHLNAKRENVEGVTRVKPTAKMIPGQIENFDFTLRRGDRSNTMSIAGNRFSATDRITYEFLPAEFLQELEDGKAEAQDFVLKISIGPAGNKPPR